MNLEQATLAALAAAESGDLDALAEALAARAEALAAGQTPTPDVHAGGELIAARLRELIRQMRREAARLERFARSLEPASEPGACFDYRG